MANWVLENILGISSSPKYAKEIEQLKKDIEPLDKQYKDLRATIPPIPFPQGKYHHYAVWSGYRKREAAHAAKYKPVYDKLAKIQEKRAPIQKRLQELKKLEEIETAERPLLKEKAAESVEGLVTQYNKKVDEYNKLPEYKKSTTEGKALKNVTEKLGERIDHYAKIYNAYDTPDLGNVKRTFKDVRRADRVFRQQKERKLAEIAAIKDPVEQKLVMERDLPYFEGTEKQLKGFKKLVNIETKNKLEELGSGNQGFIGAPEVPAATPTGTLRIPFSQRMSLNEMPSMPQDPLGKVENYLRGGNDYGFNLKGMYSYKPKKGGYGFGW